MLLTALFGATAGSPASYVRGRTGAREGRNPTSDTATTATDEHLLPCMPHNRLCLNLKAYQLHKKTVTQVRYLKTALTINLASASSQQITA